MASARGGHYGSFGAFVGLLAGVAYAVGAFFVDPLTTGLNTGTAWAFLALLGMPVLFGAAAALLGIVWEHLRRRH